MGIVNLNKQEFSKTQYERVIDTSFSQLTQPTPEVTESVNIEEFFNTYQEIFFEIPKFGESNSHEYLVKTSGEYVDFTTSNEEITALIEEVTQLRQANLELNQQIISLQTENIDV